MLGKKLYQSTSMPTIKLMAILISSTLLLNLYFQTYSDIEFLISGDTGFYAIFSFHLKYPHEFFTYFFTILIPSIYYGFIRGVSFYENGVVINRGLPFFNMKMDYAEIESYELITRNHFMSVTSKNSEDEYMFTVNRIDRALAILDQHDIRGKLGKEASDDKIAHKKLILFFIIVGILMSLLQYSGLIRQVFR